MVGAASPPHSGAGPLHTWARCLHLPPRPFGGQTPHLDGGRSPRSCFTLSLPGAPLTPPACPTVMTGPSTCSWRSVMAPGCRAPVSVLWGQGRLVAVTPASPPQRAVALAPRIQCGLVTMCAVAPPRCPPGPWVRLHADTWPVTTAAVPSLALGVEAVARAPSGSSGLPFCALSCTARGEVPPVDLSVGTTNSPAGASVGVTSLPRPSGRAVTSKRPAVSLHNKGACTATGTHPGRASEPHEGAPARSG